MGYWEEAVVMSVMEEKAWVLLMDQIPKEQQGMAWPRRNSASGAKRCPGDQAQPQLWRERRSR